MLSSMFCEDVLQSLALIEAISFEDFELGLAFSLFVGKLFSANCSEPRVYVAASAAKRLFLLAGDSAVSTASASDLVCVGCWDDSGGRTLRRLVHRLGERYAGVRICVFYGAAHRHRHWLAASFEQGERVEWFDCYAGERRRYGMLFSDGWRVGIAEQVRDSLWRYRNTRPREGLASTVRPCVCI